MSEIITSWRIDLHFVDGSTIDDAIADMEIESDVPTEDEEDTEDEGDTEEETE